MDELDKEWHMQLPKLAAEENQKEITPQNHKSEPRKKIPIKKYTANNLLPLHESVIIGMSPKFVTLDQKKAPNFVDSIKSANQSQELVPNDSFYITNPLPYIFDSTESFKQYLELGRKETLETLYIRVELIYKKYVNVEDHYYSLLIGDTVLSFFQDKFGYTHYIIIIGDNGSGKNSALLVFKYLGYRVFYVTSASAPNYYTQLGSIEEGQCTIAEDEAEDLAEDKDKRNVVKTGYCSGGSVPKVELDGGRRQDNWLTYCHKWYAMEELSENKKMKGILDRSLVLKFVIGDVPYNIKDVIRTAGDPQYKPLYDELIHTRRLLFCYRLLHHNEPILDVSLNIRNRSAELAKPLIRLFQNSPVALEKILGSLSNLMIERIEVKNNSIESKLYDTLKELRSGLQEYEDDFTLTNEQIREKLKEIVDGHDIPDKTSVFYSSEIGEISQTRITRIAKSKFKAESARLEINGKTVRCLRFKTKYLDRIRSNYNIPDKIEILTVPTLSTPVRGEENASVQELASRINIQYEKIVIKNVLSLNSCIH